MAVLSAVASAGQGNIPPTVTTEPPSGPFATGPRFRKALDAIVPGVSWKSVPLRGILRQISDGYGIAVFRDRRIDPTTTPVVSLTNVPLDEVLATIAEGSGGELRVLGNVAYLATNDAALVVRTLAELRREELSALAAADRRLAGRRVELEHGKTFHWRDLTEPAEILRLIADQFDFEVENPDLLPHDLWPGGALPDMTATEMLTVILVQFDLTFAWDDDLDAIWLVPLPDDRSSIVLERTYTPRGVPADAVAAWRERFGPLDAEVRGRRVVVRGPLETHEAVEQAISGRTVRRPETPSVAPLDRRRFTLKVARVPASAVMKKLEESGIRFEYDAAALSAAGIDLGSLVTLDVRDADAREFLAAVFGPLGLTADYAGVTVKLRPKD